MRIMAIDYGDQRTGVAVSDLTGSIAGEAFVITEWNEEALIEKLKAEAEARDVGLFVLGHPLNMDGTPGERAAKCEELCEKLCEITGLPCLLRDERRTTVDAHRILRANGRRERKHRKNVDAVAATLILEGYLNSL